jgi:hypothetical protein
MSKKNNNSNKKKGGLLAAIESEILSESYAKGATTGANRSQRRKYSTNSNQGNQPRVNRQQPSMMVGAAYSRKLVSNTPQERSTTNGSRILKFKEYVGDIAGSVAFSATSYPVQPGLPDLFAWLNSQSIFYQEYIFKSLKFCFETEKSTATTGKVLFAFQPDAADSNPSSKQEMLENQYKAGGAPWEAFMLDIAKKVPFALGKRRFVRSGDLADNLDIKTYDIGKLVVATQGMADTSDVGELYVEYEIQLYTPIQSLQSLALTFSKTISGGGTVSDTAYLGDAAVLTGGLPVTATGNTLTFNRVGKYILVSRLTGTGLFTVMTPVLSSSTATVVRTAGLSNAAANAGTSSTWNGTVNVTARGQTAVLDYDTQATTVSASASYIGLFTQ